MKKALVVSLSEEELLGLYRIILDEDEEGSLRFVIEHLRKPVDQALEGG